MAQPTTLGEQFARALAGKDFETIMDLMHPEIDFQGLTPRRHWVATDPAQAVSEVLRVWFKDSDELEALEQLEVASFADRERVGYRLSGRNPEGRFLIEQQAYLSARDGRIAWMRVLCSGYRPVP